MAATSYCAGPFPPLQNTFDGDGTRVIRVVNGTTTYFLGDWYE
jgi:hypothetical protein